MTRSSIFTGTMAKPICLGGGGGGGGGGRGRYRLCMVGPSTKECGHSVRMDNGITILQCLH